VTAAPVHTADARLRSRALTTWVSPIALTVPLLPSGSPRHKLFEGPRKQEPDPRVRELKKKRDELARVVERLQDPDVSPGMVKELRKHVAILEAAIARLTARPGSDDQS